MFKFLEKKKQSDNVNSTKEAIKTKALEISEKMSKLTEHLEIIKNMDTNDAKNIYIREKNLLAGLYEYYCKYQKLYSDISFSQILSPLDIATISNINLKDFVNQLKEYHKRDYEITIESLKDEDKITIKKTYEQFEKDFDDFVNLLINIQSDIIIQEISSIEQEATLEKIENKIGFNSVLDKYKKIEENYSNYLDEYNAAKEVFNKI
jgi:hypothetical protein